MLGAGGRPMDAKDQEFSCLVGWLRTFPLQSQATTNTELSDGLAMAEVLVQIEPATFTPTWFAGILKSQNSNNDTLNVLLNMLLHYYRHNLSEECISGDSLPVPNIPANNDVLKVEDVSRFLKLILGVAVTCNNKELFINKIQSLDETTQHALTSCIVSFISTKDWCDKVSSSELSPDPKHSQNGDEVWAQRCHELDYQVALLREERSNLMNENEELCSKVKAAQTLSRKDSMKSRHLETELAHVKDEFERLKLEYEQTRHQQKLKNGSKEQELIQRLTEDIHSLKSDLSQLQSSHNSKDSGQKYNDVLASRLESHQELINDLKTELTYQVSLQARVGQELDTVKDQVDILREGRHELSRYWQEVGDIKSRLVLLETSATTGVSGHDTTDYLGNMSQRNNQLDETTVLPSQVSLDVSIGCADSIENIIDMNQPRMEQEILAATANDQGDHDKIIIEPDDAAEDNSAATDTEPTHPLTARTVSEHDEHDHVNESHFRDVEDWNFSSVATIDSHSLTAEERQKIIIDNLYRVKKKEKPKKKIKSADDDKPTDCFNSLFLQLFVKVFD